MSRSKISKSTFGSLAALLALTATACAPIHTYALRLGGPRDVGADRPLARRHEPREIESFCVVSARVDLRRRVVTADEERVPLNPRVGIVAREIATNGKLERGTDVLVVYRTTIVVDDVGPLPGALDRSDGRCVSDGDAGESATGELVAVQLGSGPTARRAFRVRDAGGIDGFYARDGRVVEGAHLRYPVEYLVITSGFSTGRTHPILKKRKPHYGVDFAAPRGTPVVAVAAGEITKAGWAGAHGRRIDVRHGDGSTSGYSHLDRIAGGIVVGTTVRKGQVIGTVGSSGLATGPHVHFSLVRRGKPVDPLAAQIPAPAKLSEEALVRLRAAAGDFELVLAAAERESDPRATQLARAGGDENRKRDD